ncbi:MAG: fibrobacter succinogenes major paralogous domain-containing protein [Paludibacter sp.]|nr:fibrobacter succinogenes major paralogous domain-containing protein [Paludibacter sp.]
MKANRKFGMWKAIAFLTVAISIFSCTSYEPEPLVKAQIIVNATENITESSATIVATITANQDNTDVLLRYQANGSTWKIKPFQIKLSGTSSQRITFDVSDLQPSTSYNFEVMASNAAGAETVKGTSFTTLGLVKAIIKIKAAENVKIGTASLSASVVPNQNNTTIHFEYQTVNSAWKTKTLGSSFSGTDSVKVNLDISDLQANTLYNFRVRVSNKAGEVVSDIVSFTTYAVADYDGNFYHTITIGTQTWLKENFKGTHYANGDVIAYIADQTDWANQKTGAYCYYNNNSENGKVYGGLYNWYVVTDSRGLIVGYHVPSYDEWETLRSYLGGMNVAGLKLKEIGLTHWYRTNSSVTNSSGFTALPGGARTLYFFTTITEAAMFWTSTVHAVSGQASEFDLEGGSSYFGSGGNDYVYGQSIRLVKN